MQQCQRQLNFHIDTPSDEWLKNRFSKDERIAKAFADSQKLVVSKQKPKRKHKKRLQKNAKKLARLNR